MKRKSTTKPKKLRKITALTFALAFTLAGVNIASADTNISNSSQLKGFVTSGTDIGNITNNITDVNSAIGSVTSDGLTINGHGYSIDGKNSYAGFTISSSINSFVLNNLKMEHFFKNAGNGGAIDNAYGKIGNITADFIDNTANCGGAIDNSSGTIGDITGNFVNNKASAGAGNGGVINNFGGTIGNITGNFINNSASHDAGAICNGGGTITSIKGSFIGNYASNDAGAIWNNNTLNISDSTFEGNGYKDYNTSTKTGTPTTNRGGAIWNNSGGNLSFTGTNTFSNNVAKTVGGAIYNASGATLSLEGTNIFSYNKSSSNSGIAQAGAIYNGGTISSIEGDFTNNYTYSSNNYSQGGAISNIGIISEIIGNYTGNYTKSASGNALGGAIYNNGTISSISGDFKGNHADGTTAQGGAIYNAKDSEASSIYVTGNFTDNYVSGTNGVENAIGGAICNRWVLTIKDASFSGNYVTTNNGATKNLNDVFNQGTTTVLGNVSMTGGFSNNGGGTLYIGGLDGSSNPIPTILSLGPKATLNQKYINCCNGSTLDSANSAKNIYNATSVTGTGNLKLDIMSNTNDDIDKIIFTSGSPTLKITALNIHENLSEGKSFKYLSTNTIDSTLKAAAGGKLYTFADNDGTLSLDDASQITSMTLPEAIATSEVVSYSLINDEILNNNLGTLAGGSGREFTIFGNNHTIDAQKDETTQCSGITVGTGQTLNIENTTMQNFKKTGSPYLEGSVISNIKGLVNINNVTYKNNSIIPSGFITDAKGGVISNRYGSSTNKSIINISNSTFDGNYIESNYEALGSVIYNHADGDANTTVINISNSTFKNNSATGGMSTTGAIVNSYGTINLSGKNEFKNNTSNGEFIDIANYGDLNIIGTTIMDGGIDNGGSLYYGTTTIGDGSTPTLLKLGSQATFVQKEVDFNSGTLDVANGAINTLNFNTLSLTGTNNNIFADTNLLKETMDSIYITNFINPSDNKITLYPNLPTSTRDILTNPDITLYPIDKAVTGDTRSEFAQAIKAVLPKQVVSPIFIYTPLYDSSNGIISVTANSFNPSVLASSVGAQVGAYLTQISNYEQAFTGMDMLMNLTSSERTAMKLANKYAFGVNNGVMTYSPNQIPEENKGMWFRPYATFEHVNLAHGPKVENNSYGMLFGGDSDIIELKHGWDMTWGAYAGYNGSHQNYDGVSIYQNGGTFGLNTAWYKGNFFTGLTANVGASNAEASTMYGNEDFTMLMTGIASKTGYNWELFNSKLIVQPNFLMSYTFVNTFDYTNAAGVKINSDPLNAIQIVPGLKFIGNLPHGWQPYLGVQMVWNIMDDTKFRANNVSLPQMSVDPYVQYGVGLQRRWGDRFTGFGQVMLRNGGRTGVALNAGFRWALGKNPSNGNLKQSNNTRPELKKTQISLSSMK